MFQAIRVLFPENLTGPDRGLQESSGPGLEVSGPRPLPSAFKQLQGLMGRPLLRRADQGQQHWTLTPRPALVCWPDKLPSWGACIPGAPLVRRESPRAPCLRVFSAPTAAQGTPSCHPVAALPGCEGLLHASSGFPTLVPVTGSTFCPRIEFLGSCLLSGLGVFAGDFLLPELRCSGLQKVERGPRGA